MDDIYQALSQAGKAFHDVQELIGRSQGIQSAVVLRTEDPDGYGRIQVLLPSKAARSESDWIYRLMPWHGLSVPDPLPGDVAMVGFLDGDPHKGVLLGIVTNDSNPADQEKRWRYYLGEKVFLVVAEKYLSYQVGNTLIYQDAENDSVTLKAGDTTLKIDKNGDVNFTNIKNFRINGKQVLTIGSKDDDGDYSITRGW
ncbi:phage baseplate assembly protein V [Floridanema aerugineum]|uniref:Phage baseplate assembly protein V n=1 Tax=Floridaenema aerugineum BLCC-F46 TaxID=3153654 RepID=A0ABV4X264_9CYAN